MTNIAPLICELHADPNEKIKDPRPGNRRSTGSVSFNGLTATLPQNKSHDYSSRRARKRAAEHVSDDTPDRARARVPELDDARSSGKRQRRSGGFGGAKQLRSNSRTSFPPALASVEEHDRQRSRSITSEARHYREPPIRVRDPTVIDQLIMNIQRHHELRRLERELKASSIPRDSSAYRAQQHQVDMAREKQRKRAVMLYNLAYTFAQRIELRREPLLRGTGNAFFTALARNVREQHRITADESAIVEHRETLHYFVQGLDDFMRLESALQLDMFEDDLDELRRVRDTIRDMGKGIAAAEKEYFTRYRELEQMYEAACEHEAELYRLAAVLLDAEGLLVEGMGKDSSEAPLLRLSAENDKHDHCNPKHSGKPDSENDGHGKQQEAPPPRILSQHVVQHPRPAGAKNRRSKEYQEAKQELAEAQQELDQPIEKVKARIDHYRKVYARRNIPADRDEVDRMLLHRGRDMTEEVRKAERRLEDAKLRVAEVGVLPRNQTSDFGEYPEDRAVDTQSVIRRTLADFDRQPIESWLKRVDALRVEERRRPRDPLRAREEREVDPFVVRDIELGESFSAVAVGKWRAKIDRARM